MTSHLAGKWRGSGRWRCSFLSKLSNSRHANEIKSEIKAMATCASSARCVEISSAGPRARNFSLNAHLKTSAATRAFRRAYRIIDVRIIIVFLLNIAYMLAERKKKQPASASSSCEDQLAIVHRLALRIAYSTVMSCAYRPRLDPEIKTLHLNVAYQCRGNSIIVGSCAWRRGLHMKYLAEAY